MSRMTFVIDGLSTGPLAPSLTPLTHSLAPNRSHAPLLSFVRSLIHSLSQELKGERFLCSVHEFDVSISYHLSPQCSGAITDRKMPKSRMRSLLAHAHPHWCLGSRVKFKIFFYFFPVSHHTLSPWSGRWCILILKLKQRREKKNVLRKIGNLVKNWGMNFLLRCFLTSWSDLSVGEA